MPQNPVSPASSSPAADEERDGKEPGRYGEAENCSQQRQAAGADLHLPLQLERLPPVDHRGQAGLAPAVQPALENESVAALVDLGGERGGIAARARAGAAVEDHRRGRDGRRSRSSSSFESAQMAAAGNMFARVFVGFPNIHENGALVHETLGLVRPDAAQGHDAYAPLFILRDGATKQPVQGGKQLLGSRIGDAIPDGLGVTPEGDDAFLAHLGEVLRQRGLGKPDRLGQRVTFASPHSTSLHRIISLRSLASARSMSAACRAFCSKAALDRMS